MTAAEQLLLAAIALGPRSFHAEELAVAAWREFPERFGMRGFERLYPDFKAVSVAMADRNGTCVRGWIRRLPSKLPGSRSQYVVTERGAEAAKKLREGQVA